MQHCLHDLWFFSFMRSSLRTLITGMASGSIVAFNIDFNRWHYEHQNRYWGGQHEEEGAEQRGERRWRILQCECDAGEITATKRKQKKNRTFGSIPLWSLLVRTWQCWWTILPPPSTRVCTHTHTHACNTYTPIEKIHTKICWSNVKSESCRPSKLDYTGRSHNWPLARLKLHRAKNFLFSLIFFFSLNNTQIFLLGKLSVGIILGVL